MVSLQSQPLHISASQTLSDFKNCSANKTFKRNSSLLNFIDIVSKEDQEKFELSFAMFVFGNCLPLNITENRSTIDHYKSIRPGFLLPSRHKLSNKLLNTHYDKLLLNLKEKINKSYCLGLTCDGWTNVKGDSIINFIFTTPEPIFLKSIDTKSNKHSGVYMKDIIINVLKEFGEMKFTSVVTDNASNMKAAWNLIQNYYPHISCYGCVAHGLNLLVQDITTGLEPLKEVVVELKHVIKEIKNKHILLSVLKEKQSLLSGNLPSLKLPGATRWGSIVRSMQSLIDNKSCLKAMCIDERVELTVTQQTKNCILMDVFWERIETFYKLLKPLAHYLKLVQGDKLNLSIVCTIFSELEKDFKEFISLEVEPALKNEELKILVMLENRRDFCLKKIHLAANILDPNTFGKDLKDGEDIEAIEFIINMGENNADIEINNLIS